MNEMTRRAVLTRGSMAAAAAYLGATAVQAAAGEAPRRSNGKFKSIDAAMSKAVSDRTVAGAVAMAATQKGMIYEGLFGKANPEAGAPMQPDTVFWLLSMTKAITATACMQLIEQGRLKLDDDASKYLPQLAAPKVLVGFDANGQPQLRPAKNTIKVHHLLTHTSGYTYANWSDVIPRYETATGLPDIATCENAAFNVPLEFEPGERWQYGISMDWTGKLVEAVSDQSLEVYFRENIFQPLGMKDSGFLISSEQKRRVATCFSRESDGGLKAMPFEMPQRPEFFMGGGGAYSTPRDYMMLLQALLHGGKFNGAKILKPETVAMMMQNQIGELNVRKMISSAPAYSNSFDQFPEQKHKWGYSFDINTEAGPHGRSAGSVSWAGLLNCYFWIDPVRKVTGSLFTQLLPFYDDRVVALYGDFERGLYDGLA
ncbi:serine hydrolase domain-containing protein [Rhizobium sp. BK376]|uniref:serine hydrolase domain-containing protein n=1 Tax=Rhizobium sp. BK376 TaxID=2512149 RepID=UPI00104D48A3|nr:serine hydrolase domain-containing protein [Rhizobium sp. BK376]TCR73376.1 CubicO group peptidase (beta-lactamase class C family) [Rhizobium sp. BK376]